MNIDMNMNETQEKDNFIKNKRKEMTKLKCKVIVIKYKETEEKINQNIKKYFDLGKNNSIDSDDEKENNKENNSNKPRLLTDKTFISNKHFSILDVLSFKNKKLEI